MAFKLFDDIILELEKKIDTFKYELPKPETVNKEDMIEGLEKLFSVPKDVQDWLPDQIVIERFLVDRTTNPDTFDFAFTIDPPSAFEPFPNIITVKKATIEVKTTKKVGEFEE